MLITLQYAIIMAVGLLLH